MRKKCIFFNIVQTGEGSKIVVVRWRYKQLKLFKNMKTRMSSIGFFDYINQSEKQTWKNTKDLNNGKRKHSCNQCKYSTDWATHMKTHMLVHSRIKSFACSQCKYSCKQAGNLKKHLLTHSGEKAFNCFWRSANFC